VLARFQLDAGGVEPIDMVGHHAGLASVDGGEQSRIGHQAQPLVPRIVGRGESLGVVLGAQRLLDAFGQEIFDCCGLVARAFEHQVLHAHVLEARDRIGQLFGQDLAQEVGDGVFGGADTIPCRRALQHG
jgi:hypothetical protein